MNRLFDPVKTKPNQRIGKRNHHIYFTISTLKLYENSIKKSQICVLNINGN